MKTLIFLTKQIRWSDNKPFKNRLTDKAFSLFTEIADENKIKVYFSSPSKYKDETFTSAWTKEDKGKWKKEEKSIKNVDFVYSYLIYTRKNIVFLNKLKKYHKIINDPEFTDLCFDKYKISQLILEKDHPQTFLVKNKEQYKRALKKIKTEKAVIKPRFGLRGRDVKLITKNNEWEDCDEDMIVQEFIETSGGFKKGFRSDFRVMMINSAIDHAYLRVPEKKEFKANCSLGAKKIFVKNIPEEIKKIVFQIDKNLKKYSPRIYSVDFLLSQKGKFLVLELESMPGFYFYQWNEGKRIKYLNNIFQAINKI